MSWQAPSMSAPSSTKTKVDEKVVRTLLRVNPDLRRGRTTGQIKRALEAGESLAFGVVNKSAGRPAVLSSELADTIGFFLRGKAERLRADLESIAARRRALDEEAARLGHDTREQLARFVGLLDGREVDEKGPAALAEHRDLLKAVGLTPTQLLELAKKARR
jgi:hypothetical protein